MTEQTTDEFMKDLTEDQRQLLRLMRYAVRHALIEREAKTRSFWRAVFDAVWSMLSHGHALIQKLFKE